MDLHQTTIKQFQLIKEKTPKGARNIISLFNSLHFFKYSKFNGISRYEGEFFLETCSTLIYFSVENTFVPTFLIQLFRKILVVFNRSEIGKDSYEVNIIVTVICTWLLKLMHLHAIEIIDKIGQIARKIVSFKFECLKIEGIEMKKWPAKELEYRICKRAFEAQKRV